MACNYSAGNLSYLTEGLNGTSGPEAITCQYELVVGATTLGLFVFGTLALMYYIADDSFVVPTVLAVMLGGVVFASVPPGLVRIAALVFVLIATVSVLYIVDRIRAGN